MDTAPWPQEIGLVSSTTATGNNNNNNNNNNSNNITSSSTTRPPQIRARPQKEQALNCPRCNSTNTKFCYYNNYSLTQPRYFCKTCRRYWTEGGSLRNVPVGGGSRKNKRSSTTSSSSLTNTNSSTITTMVSSSSRNQLTSPDLTPPPISLSSQNPKFHEGQDLNLAIPYPSLPAEFGQDFPSMESSTNNNNTRSCNYPSSSAPGALSAMDFLRSGIPGRGLGPFMDPSAVYSSGFSLQDLRPPTLNFPLGGIGGGYGGLQRVQENDGRLLFPFEDLKQQVPPSTSTAEFEQNRGQGGETPAGYWNGIMGGGGGSW